MACVGGGSNAIGIFYPFLNDDVELIGVEAGGKGSRPANIRLRSAPGSRGCCTGRSRTCCRTRTGRCCPPTVYSAGLDYPGVGPEHAMLKDSHRVTYTRRSTTLRCSTRSGSFPRTEGIIPALESAHAVAWVMQNADRFDRDDIVVINLSGRGDKDVAEVARTAGGCVMGRIS